MTCCTCKHVQQQLQLQSNARRLRCAGYDAQANLQLYLHVTVQVSGLRVACTGLHRQVCMYRCACTGLYVQVCVYRSQVCMLYCSATCSCTAVQHADLSGHASIITFSQCRSQVSGPAVHAAIRQPLAQDLVALQIHMSQSTTMQHCHSLRQKQ